MTAPHQTPRSRQRLVVTAATLAVVVLAAGLVTVVVRRSEGSTSTSTLGRPKTTVTDTPPSSGATTTAPPEAPDEPAYITKIKRQVADVRGLAWKAPLTVDVVSRDELGRRTRLALERDRNTERMAGDGDTFRILHLIPADLDYIKAVDDLLSGLVLGFYDPETKELVVGQTATDGSDDVDGSTKVVLAHELDHALTDQWFDFGATTKALDDADREEEVDALTALIEGDAKSVEPRFADKYLSEEEQLSYALGSLGSADTDASAKILDTPAFIRDYLYFPYDAGLAFVKAQATNGADLNAGIDAAYRRPPTSTEQVLHPEVYATNQGPNPPDLPDLAAATGCESRRRNSLGEFKMTEVLDAELDTAKAKAAATGWDGDVFETVRCGTSLALVDRWQADSDAAATRLAAALTEWAPGWAGSGPPVNGRFSGPGGTGRIVRSGSRVDLILGADASTADRLAAAAGG